MSCQRSQVLAICLQSTRSREPTQHQRYCEFILTTWDNSSLSLYPWERKRAWNWIKGVAVCCWGMPLEILLMLDAFLWSQLQHIAELINLATVSDTHKFSLFFSGWAVHEMIWVSSNVFVIHKDSQNSLDQHFSACNMLRLMICNPLSTFHGLWFVFQVKCHYLCLPGSDRSFINRIVISIE